MRLRAATALLETSVEKLDCVARPGIERADGIRHSAGEITGSGRDCC